MLGLFLQKSKRIKNRIMSKEQKLRKALTKRVIFIHEAQRRVDRADNNIDYIRNLYALKKHLETYEYMLRQLEQITSINEQVDGRYAGQYQALFKACAWTFSYYDRVLNSITEYKTNKPF